MAKSNTSNTVNPFAAAQRKAPSGAKKSDAPIIVAADTKTYDGSMYSKSEVIGAINGYVEGHQLFEQGKAMKDVGRTTIVAVARTKYAQEWLMNGKRPSNPKMVTDETGDGAMLSVIFMDSVSKLDEISFGNLASLIGEDKAEELTLKRDDFVINPELLDQTVLVKKDGKNIKQNVMDAIAEALQDKFGPSPEILASLFQVIPKFETTKGLIDKGLELVAPDKSADSAEKLARFLEFGRFTTQIKTGATGN